MSESISPREQSGEKLNGPPMVRIPEGWFLMGSESGQDNERPVHRVWVDAFELAATQVSRGEYSEVSRDNRHGGSHKIGATRTFLQPAQPVVAVSWFRRHSLL